MLGRTKYDARPHTPLGGRSSHPVSGGRVGCSGCSGALLLGPSSNKAPRRHFDYICIFCDLTLTPRAVCLLSDLTHACRVAQAQSVTEAFRAGFQAGFQTDLSPPANDTRDKATAAAKEMSNKKAEEMKQAQLKVEAALDLKTKKLAKAEKDKKDADKAAAAATTEQAKKAAAKAKRLAEERIGADNKKVAAAKVQAQETKVKKQKAEQAAAQANKIAEKANGVSKKSSSNVLTRSPPRSTKKATASNPSEPNQSPNATLENTTKKPFDYHCPSSCSTKGMKGFQSPQNIKFYVGASDSGIVVKGCSWSCSCNCKCVISAGARKKWLKQKGKPEAPFGKYVCDSCTNNGLRTTLKVDFHASAAGKLSSKEYLHATRPLYVEKYMVDRLIPLKAMQEKLKTMCTLTREQLQQQPSTARKGRSAAGGSRHQKRVTTVRQKLKNALKRVWKRNRKRAKLRAHWDTYDLFQRGIPRSLTGWFSTGDGTTFFSQNAAKYDKPAGMKFDLTQEFFKSTRGTAIHDGRDHEAHIKDRILKAAALYIPKATSHCKGSSKVKKECLQVTQELPFNSTVIKGAIVHPFRQVSSIVARVLQTGHRFTEKAAQHSRQHNSRVGFKRHVTMVTPKWVKDKRVKFRNITFTGPFIKDGKVTASESSRQAIAIDVDFNVQHRSRFVKEVCDPKAIDEMAKSVQKGLEKLCAGYAADGPTSAVVTQCLRVTFIATQYSRVPGQKTADSKLMVAYSEIQNLEAYGNTCRPSFKPAGKAKPGRMLLGKRLKNTVKKVQNTVKKVKNTVKKVRKTVQKLGAGLKRAAHFIWMLNAHSEAFAHELDADLRVGLASTRGAHH